MAAAGLPETYLFLEALKKTRVKRGDRSQNLHQVCDKQPADTEKRHLVHSIQALQHKTEQLIC